MKIFLNSMLFILFMHVQIAQARTVEIEVYGMTCAFCVDSLERAFSKIDSVNTVQVSLKMKKILLDTEVDEPSIETIKQTVLNSGFTPIKITVLSADN